MTDPPGLPPGGGDKPNGTTLGVIGPRTAWRETRAQASPASAAGAASSSASAAAAHALYILLDSNLPTGGFVASSGLESAAKHGCLRERGYGVAGGVDLRDAGRASGVSASGHNGSSTAAGVGGGDGGGKGTRTGARGGTFGTGSAAPRSAPPLGPRAAAAALTAFADAEVHNFEASTGWYLRQAHGVAASVREGRGGGEADAGAAPSSDVTPAAVAGGHVANSHRDDDTGAGPTAATSANADAADADADAAIDAAVTALTALDAAHDATLLSHVARRASRAQGIALLTLFVRGMGPPPGFDYDDDDDDDDDAGVGGGGVDVGDALYGGTTDGVDEDGVGDAASAVADPAAASAARDRAHALVSAYKLAIRRGSPGHLAVCFGVVAAALGIDLETTRHLYLFTHARSLLSSAVRLNIVGPYLSTQLLAHPLRRVIRDAMRSSLGADAGGGGGGVSRRPAADGAGPGAGPDAGTGKPDADDTLADADTSRPDAPGKPNMASGSNLAGPAPDPWAWADDAERGPATTWPLGEILAARHDLQHSRIFNS